ncbi:MAG: MarR family transcriptional regulator [Enterococcus sp.]|jgi:DNA-binding MarR family transcriptional regulator|uniref:MarR family winged helix-turn-helix transcriptional regulator n=1 Tax=Enterococcus sp. TaxID=35783 RepID=UPI002FCBDFFC
MNEQQESNLKWLAKLTREYQKSLDQALMPLRLNSSNYYFIMKIHDFGRLPQEKLASLTGLNGSNVTRTVQKLIDQGFVVKEKNEQDRRGFLLALTGVGEAIYGQVLVAVKDAQATFYTNLNTEEQELFEQLLGKLAEE